MIMIFMGAPGVGKGTQSNILSRKLNLPHISTGDILRQNIKDNTEIGIIAKDYIDKGLLVPCKYIMELVNKRIQESDCEKGFIMDGFPRTLQQAEDFDRILINLDRKIKAVFNINLDYNTLMERIVGRLTCSNCGANYHVKFSKPQKENICDICESELISREDDNEETFKNRYEEYTKLTKPLIEYYEEKGLLVQIDASKGKNRVTEDILKSLGV